MMWGALWDSVREGEMDPRVYVDLVVKNIKLESDESTIQTLLSRVSTAMRYYIDAGGGSLSVPPAVAGGLTRPNTTVRRSKARLQPPATAGGSDRLEALLIDRMQNAPTPGQKITYYRAFLALGSSDNARRIMKEILKQASVARASVPPAERVSEPPAVAGGLSRPTANSKRANPRQQPPATAGGSDRSRPTATSTKDRFDIVQRLIILGDPDAAKLLAELERTETSDDAKRYAYAARAGFATAENKAKFWNDFVNNKDISENWIEAAFGPFNNIRHSELTLPYLERALNELPNHKRNRKIFFVNGWLGAFIGGQKSEQALAIINKFLADNRNLDNDLRLKILENADIIERAVKIRAKY
jgi:aminopeptidase N